MSNTILEIMIAEREISRLIATYAHALDNGKFEEVAKLLKNTKMDVAGVNAEGREEIERFLIKGVQRHADGTTRTLHSVSNLIIDIDLKSGIAKSVSYFTVYQELGGQLPLQIICTGQYEDSFMLNGGAWEFSSRSVVPRMLGDLRFHVGK